MQLCMGLLLVFSDFQYHENSASYCAKTSFLGPKWHLFQSHYLSFWDMQNRRLPKDAPCETAYLTYQTLNSLINIHGLNWGNRLVKTRTEPAGSGFSRNRYSWNGPKTEPLLTLMGKYTSSFLWFFFFTKARIMPSIWLNMSLKRVMTWRRVTICHFDIHRVQYWNGLKTFMM